MSDTFPDEQGVSDSQTSNRTIVPAKQSIVTTRQTCPLCQARSRQYIDTLISETRDAAKPVIDEETGEILEIGTQVSFTEIEKGVRELLRKFGDDTEFTLADLIIHAGEHAMVTQINGVSIRSEGKYLIVGDEIYEKYDPKDVLALGISKGAHLLATNQMKITGKELTNWMILLWRMMGNSSPDEFVQTMIEKTTRVKADGGINADTPLGASYVQHQQNLAKKQARVAQDEAEQDKVSVETAEVSNAPDG